MEGEAVILREYNPVFLMYFELPAGNNSYGSTSAGCYASLSGILLDRKSRILPFFIRGRNLDPKQCTGVLLWQPSQPHPPVWLGE